VRGGYVGVDVFFVISGFLITGLLLRERSDTGKISIVAFYARRVRRILPAATVVVILTVLAAYHFLGFLEGDSVANDARWASVFLANIHFAAIGTQYFSAEAPPSPLQHMWSLGVEEQFYVVWPTVVLLVGAVLPRVSLRMRLGAVLGVIIVASFSWSVIETLHNGTRAYFSPLTRAWELAAGGLLAVAAPLLGRIPRKVAIWLGFLYTVTRCIPGQRSPCRCSGPQRSSLPDRLRPALVRSCCFDRVPSNGLASARLPCTSGTGRFSSLPWSTPGTHLSSGRTSCWCWSP
jgi:peptidoglycan/LPS O-acetylase OafA/YrhL